MFGWFRSDPSKSLERKIAKKYDEAVQLQRNGRLREYGALMKEIEGLEAELESMQASS